MAVGKTADAPGALGKCPESVYPEWGPDSVFLIQIMLPDNAGLGITL